MGIFQKGAKSPAPSFSLDLRSALPSLSSSKNSPSPQLHPLVSPGFEDVPIWNILPSYQLYGSTFSKDMDPSSEDYHDDPPTYEVSTPHSGSTESGDDYFSASHAGSAQNQAARWERTILANTHRLKRLASFNKPLADKLKIDLTFTKSPGARGRSPDIYDPSAVEFSQGDAVHGFVTVVNTHAKPLIFDMFSVVFEGRVSVNSDDETAGSKPILFYKYLNMFDYNASWTPAYFEESADGVNRSKEIIDPVDGSNLYLPVEQKIEPGMVYKKFFNFTIPDKLLDCACESHSLPNHCCLLPTLGLDKSSFLQRLRKMREAPAKPEKPAFSVGGPSPPQRPQSPKPKRQNTPNMLVRDFSFPDTSISYNVEARLVGKLSSYSTADNCSKDEFIIVKEAAAPVRIIPVDLPTVDAEEEDKMVKKQYNTFVKDVKAIIERGRALDEGLAPTVSRRGSIQKHVYTDTNKSTGDASRADIYEVLLPYKKKTLALPPKVVGMLKATLPREEQIVRYVMPHTLRPSAEHEKRSSPIKVRIGLQYSSTDGKSKPPEIRSVSAKISVCTVRSKKYPIPVELSRDMKFENTLASNDGIERVVIAPFGNYLSQITALVEKHCTSGLGVDQQTMMDIKCLANLEVKNNQLKLDNTTAKSPGGMSHWEENTPGTSQKVFDIVADFEGLFTKSAKASSDDIIRGALSLVPSFQSCIVCRYYYLLVEFKLGNGDTLPVKVPVRIAK